MDAAAGSFVLNIPRGRRRRTCVVFALAACLNAAPSYGSLTARASCASAAVSEAALRPGLTDVSYAFYEKPGCSGSTTLLIAPAGACRTGFRVSCTSAAVGVGGSISGGVWSGQCADPGTCEGGCAFNTPFQSHQCLSNPGSTGSSSVMFSCNGTLPAGSVTGSASGKVQGSGASLSQPTLPLGIVGLVMGIAAMRILQI